jgi:Fructose-2,6-bisphosphatase
MGTLILVRHASTDASREMRNLGHGADPPLSPAGLRLAKRLGRTVADELGALGTSELRVLASPALRCRQTAAEIAGGLGLAPPLEVERGLLEINYGEWEGLTSEECTERDPDLRAAWEADPFTIRTPGGECGADVAARAFPIFEAVQDWLSRDAKGGAIVVAHNHVNRLWLTALMGWPMADYRRLVSQDPGGYSVIGYGGDTPRVRRINAIPRKA